MKVSNMKLNGRIERLERAHDASPPELIELDLASDMLLRIETAKIAGTFPNSLTDMELEAILAAGDKVRKYA